MAPLPELMPEIIGEILLCLPPDEPAHLLRTALVCKPWLRTLCDPAFLRRYRAFHRAPPLLGLLRMLEFFEENRAQRLAPTTAAPLSLYPDSRRSCPIDCRHGRALLHLAAGGGDRHFVVWEPVTGDQQRLPEPSIPCIVYSAAVFCAVAGCDHLDCHGGPFRVAFIANDGRDKIVKASMYSSETSAWSMTVSLDINSGPYAKHLRGAHHLPFVQQGRGAIIGDGIYFTLMWHNVIVKYDWSNNYLSMINPRSPDKFGNRNRNGLMVTEDGSLGFACIEDSSLSLWSRKVNLEGDAEWVQSRVIKLDKIIPDVSLDDDGAIFVVGSAEGVGVIFIWTYDGLFALELKTEWMRKVDECGGHFSAVLP